MDIQCVKSIISMATAVASVPVGARVPFCILALAIRIETQAFAIDATDLVAAFEELQLGVRTLLDKYIEIETSIAKTHKAVDRFLEDIQPVWDDAYNLCGDASCDGTCMVCADGEYLGEEDYDEKYCRRGKR